MAHLYLIESDVKVGFSQGQAVVSHPSGMDERHIPFADIEGVSVFGMAQLSTRFIRECIMSNVPICYYSDDGHYFGMTSSSEHINPERQKRQIYLTDDEEFCLQWSRTVIDAKIRNSLALLDLHGAACGLTEEDTKGLRHSLESLPNTENIDMVSGFEGNAPKCYFKCLSRLVLPDEFKFAGRSSRPPKDPFNSMLSYGYSILYRNIIGAIERHGLHPYFAFMHKTRLGHAALASDLIEDLRAPVVDRVVLGLVNSGEVGPDDFIVNDMEAIYMTRRAMCRVTAAFSDAFVRSQQFFSAYGNAHACGLQVMLDKKVGSTIEAIDKGDASFYTPFIWELED